MPFYLMDRFGEFPDISPQATEDHVDARSLRHQKLAPLETIGSSLDVLLRDVLKLVTPIRENDVLHLFPQELKQATELIEELLTPELLNFLQYRYDALKILEKESLGEICQRIERTLQSTQDMFWAVLTWQEAVNRNDSLERLSHAECLIFEDCIKTLKKVESPSFRGVISKEELRHLKGTKLGASQRYVNSLDICDELMNILESYAWMWRSLSEIKKDLDGITEAILACQLGSL